MQPATRTIQYRPGERILERIGARVKGRCVSGLRQTSAGTAEGFSFDIGVQRSSACGATNQGSLKCVKTAICEGNVWPVKKGSAATQIQSDTPLVSFARLRGKKGVLRAPSWPFAERTVSFAPLRGPSWKERCPSRPFVALRGSNRRRTENGAPLESGAAG